MKSNIKELMEKRGYTVRKVQEKADLSHLTIFRARDDQKIEQCTLRTLIRIAAALDVAVKDLFEEDDPGTD